MDIKLLGLEELSTKEMKACNGGREYWNYVGSNGLIYAMCAAHNAYVTVADWWDDEESTVRTIR